MFGALLDQTASIQRAAVTKDSSAGAVRVFAQILADCPVSIQPAGSHTIDAYSRRDIEMSHTIYTTTDLSTALSGGLLENDVFIDGGGTKYVVVGVRRQFNAILSSEPLYEIVAMQRIL